MKDETVFQNPQKRDAYAQFVAQGLMQVTSAGWTKLLRFGRIQLKLAYSPTGWGTVSFQGNLENYFIRVGTSQAMDGRRRFNVVFWRFTVIGVRTNPNEDPWS